MKYLKYISNFLNEDIHYESFHKPKWFFLVSRKPYLEKINSMKLEGVMGISSSPEIINRWFDIRDVMIVMPSDKLIEMNNLHPVYYYNPDQLVSNNFKLIIRLKQDYKSPGPEKTVVNGILKNTMNQMEMYGNYEKQYKFKDRQKERYALMKYLNRRSWEISEYVYRKIEEGFIVKNMNDFNNIVYSAIMSDTVREETGSNIPYGEIPLSKKSIDKNLLMKVLKGCVYYLGNVFNDEAEWIVKDKTLKVPEGSKLVIKQDVGNYAKKKYDNRGITPEELEEIFNELPGLKKNYEVILVDNKDIAYEMFKDVNK